MPKVIFDFPGRKVTEVDLADLKEEKDLKACIKQIPLKADADEGVDTPEAR